VYLDRLLYVDDSGTPSEGLVVYGWVEFAPDRWASVLGSWLALRKRLARDSSVPVTTELHSTAFINGRGRISHRIPDRHVHDGVDYWKDFGRELAQECLDTLRSCEGLRVGAVWRRGEPGEIATTRRETYAALIQRLEDELARADSLAMVLMDGDGSDTSYRSTHRDLTLSRRRVIEDAIYLDSRSSQLIQMADLVAWTAHVAVDQHAGNEFAWDWYDTYLAQRDPDRGPQPI